MGGQRDRARRTHDYATIEKTLDRDYFLSAEDARTFGIVDKVITKRDPLDEKIQQLMPVS